MSKFAPVWTIVDRVATLALLIASATVGWAYYTGRLAPAAAAEPRPGGGALVERVSNLQTNVTPMSRGSASAGIAIVEFSDFECPFCGRHARESVPKVMAEFVDSGKAKYVFRHFPLERIHPNAFAAAEAVECAGVQGAFWPMHRVLFGAQRNLTRPELDTHATQAGLNLANFKSCLDARTTSDRVRADIAEARRLDVASTPTIFIGRISGDGSVDLRVRIKGAVAIETLRKAVEATSKN